MEAGRAICFIQKPFIKKYPMQLSEYIIDAPKNLIQAMK